MLYQLKRYIPNIFPILVTITALCSCRETFIFGYYKSSLQNNDSLALHIRNDSLFFKDKFLPEGAKFRNRNKRARFEGIRFLMIDSKHTTVPTYVFKYSIAKRPKTRELRKNFSILEMYWHTKLRGDSLYSNIIP